MIIGTRFSPCRRYRYTLERDLGMWGDGVVLFLMLNPSTADGFANDPTLRRCITFGTAWGFKTLLVGNLYAWRSPYPEALLEAADPVGPDNRIELLSMLAAADQVICAWGQRGPNANWYDATIALIFRERLERGLSGPYYLRMNGNGCPGHPLYLPGATVPQQWER